MGEERQGAYIVKLVTDSLDFVCRNQWRSNELKRVAHFSLLFEMGNTFFPSLGVGNSFLMLGRGDGQQTKDPVRVAKARATPLITTNC